MNSKFYHFFFLSVIVLTVFILWASDSQAQGNNCAVIISNPSHDGVEVGRGMIVRGTASIPSGNHLWVLSRRSDFDGVWWPQAEGRINAQTHEWKVNVTFGQSQDIGMDFEIGVIIINETNHLLLQAYRMQAMRTGDWRPIEAPACSCPTQIRKVIKRSHD